MSFRLTVVADTATALIRVISLICEPRYGTPRLWSRRARDRSPPPAHAGRRANIGTGSVRAASRFLACSQFDLAWAEVKPVARDQGKRVGVNPRRRAGLASLGHLPDAPCKPGGLAAALAVAVAFETTAAHGDLAHRGASEDR